MKINTVILTTLGLYKMRPRDCICHQSTKRSLVFTYNNSTVPVSVLRMSCFGNILKHDASMTTKKLQSYASVNSGRILVKCIRKSNFHQIVKCGKNITFYKLHHKHDEM